MGFIYPQMFWSLLAIIPVIAIWQIVQRRRDKRLANFSVRENWDLLNPYVSGRARFHKGALIVLALALSVVAAARPFWGTQEREVQQRGTNILFAVDVSDSMLANDVIPSRLEYAKTLLRQILVEVRGNRIGIMPFAGEAFLQCPLTSDYGIAQEVLAQITVESVGVQGTDIPEVLKLAEQTFERSGGGSRILVLLTDGEDHSQAITDAAEQAAEKGIRIFALGVGTQEGSPIRMPDGTFKEADDGTKVFSRLDPQILRDLAEKTNGRAYIAGSGGRIDPSPLINDLKSIEKEDLGEDKRIVREERYQWPLALALLCLMIESLIGERRRPMKKPGRREVRA